MRKAKAMLHLLVRCGCVVSLLWAGVATAQDLVPMMYHNPVRSVWTQQTGSSTDQAVIKVIFKESVTKQFVEDSLYVTNVDHPDQAVSVTVKETTDHSTNNIIQPSHNKLSPNSAADQVVMINGQKAHKMWLLEPVHQLPADAQFKVKIRNTSPESTETANGSGSDITVYQFHTDKSAAGSGGGVKKLFDPSTWGK